ncbi:MAG: hypothetical protein APF78_03675 [Sphingomonadales bacterium BRH_c3]|nr:MAG: hypothetical protein APF78_03675 [Sphingomonadales bacterium BRH_c3]
MNNRMERIRAEDFVGLSTDVRRRLDARSFLVGLALPLQQGAWTFSNVSSSTNWRWNYLESLARTADQGGLDYLFMGSQYFPPGGVAGRHRTHSLEAVALANGIAALTERIFLFPTLSALGECSPVYFARVLATLDQISQGRAGVNLMPNLAIGDLGGALAEQKVLAQRYRVADEFVRIVKMLWSSNEFVSYDGEFYQVYKAHISPRPIQSPFPLIMSADLTPDSADFLIDHCQMRFVLPNSSVGEECGPLSLRGVRATALQYAVCRRSREEAEIVADRLKDGFDPETLAGHNRKFSREDCGPSLDSSLALGGTATFPPIVGTPTDVVDRFLTLKQQGLGGVHMSFADYEEDLKFWVSDVMPLIREAGLL